MDYYAIVHNDFDGVASAAIYARAIGNLPKTVFFTEPNKIHDLLGKLELRGIQNIMVADIGISASTFDILVQNLRKLISQGAKIQWFDHHVWKEEWKKRLSEIGVEIYIDTSTCGAGVVLKYLNPNDEFSKKLASADCSVDMWLHDDPMGEKLRRVVESNKDYSWKLHLINKFYQGVLWDEEFEKILIDQIDKELKGFEQLHKYIKVLNIQGKKIVVAVRWKGPPDISYAAQFLMNRYNAVMFVSSNGKAISFRSNTIEVRKYAEKLGGGGHPLAAAAGVKAPFWRFLLNRLGFRKPMLNWLSKIVTNVINELGFIPYQKKDLIM